MRAVNALILERMGSPVPLIPKLAKYLVEAGGKRVRPLVTIAAAKMIGYSGDAHLKLAAAVEFIHTATLLHDDVVDESDLRRGKKAANLVWGNAPSVLVGDFLFARAFMLMVDAGSMDALHSLSRASSIIAEGEVRQLAAKGDIAASIGSYMEIIEAKTAALFASAAEVSAIVADRPQADITALDTYGRELGLAFQLVDDALDYGGLSKDLGKNTGDDFREGKITLPVVIALQNGDETEKRFWSRVMTDGEQDDSDFDTAMELLEKHGALKATLAMAEEKAQIAKDALSGFPDNEWKSALEELADFVVSRAS
ncbi:polyprenyl synthetase family protein [Hyphobacterium sp. HN65]|uniref:Polyprenyl synthetase family protein n=1 Tax=Hyphobacterium lacteum TaxID=3116575 RepID=A0ABU7LN10_9PROT|nr:polyprenyl synthetase family protein [Hyphobacterium sp. HN65]MEE2525268.1 polyprenyl synthetase family protein [Hyphobacterium sp. HN65]